MSVNGFKTAAAKLEDVELWLSPDIATGADAVRIEGDVLEIKLTKGALNQSSLVVKASLDSVLCRHEHGGQKAWERRWRQHVLSLYVRGTLVFDGPIEAAQVVWGGSKKPGAEHELPGSTVTVTALNWLTALARRRVIKTSTKAKWSATDTPNRLLCRLIRENMVTGTVVTPTGWQQGSETRDDFGDAVVACPTPTAAGSSITHQIDRNNNLLDSLLELCNSPASDADWLWPTESRSGATVTFGVLRGRSGGSRQIGVDRSTVASGMIGGGPFSAERGNLIGYELQIDRVNKANHVEAMGGGKVTGQRSRYKASAGDIAADGPYEDVTLVPSGHTDAELDQEAQRVINDRIAGQERGKYVIAEIPGAVWPTHFDLADTVPVYTPLGEAVTEEVLGVIWTLVAPGPARLELDLGPWPAIPERDLGRAGGGGRGGRGGGGKARSKAGESEVDPDSIDSYSRIKTQSGDVDAEGPNHYISLKGKDISTYVRALTSGSDSGSSDNPGSPDTVDFEIRGDFVAGPSNVTGYVLIRNTLGTGSIRLLATPGPT
jgi:hypothetical protein